MIEKEVSSKILHIGSNINGRGGIPKFLRSYSELFEEWNYIRATSNGNVTNRTLVYMKSLILLFIALVKGQIEIIHIHSSAAVLLHKVAVYIIVSSLFGKKILLHIHASGFEDLCKSHTNWLKWLFKKIDLIICVSKDIDSIVKRYQLSTKTILLYNLIDKPFPTYIKKIDTKTHFLFMGEIIERKGIYDLLEVLKEHKSYFEGKMILSIAGGGNTQKLFKLINQYQIRDLVNYLGWIDSEEKAIAYSQADVFILPSYSESFGLVNLEANSYGLPVISTKVGGIPEIIHHGENGILVSPGKNEEIFKSMRYLMENNSIRKKMGERGKEIASQFYPEEIENQLRRIYDSFI